MAAFRRAQPTTPPHLHDRAVQALLATIVALSAVLASAACDDRAGLILNPARPAPPATPAPVQDPIEDYTLPPVVSGESSATLEVPTFRFKGTSPFFVPTFTLRETGGRSGAWIKDITYRLGFRSDGAGRNCLLNKQAAHVPAGGTWTSDLVYTYCLGLTFSNPAVGTQGVLDVQYLDDDGHAAIASATTVWQPSMNGVSSSAP
jgi:hypothetical protein